MNIVALDLSLTSPGVADDDGARVVKVPAKLRGVERLQWIRHQLRPVYERAHLVVIEGYSFNSRNGGERIGELGGVIRVDIVEHGARFVEISPAARAKYATGKGNAGKDEVLAAAVRRGADVVSNDAADAWWLRQMALDHYGLASLQMPALNRAALDKVEWPLMKELV